MKSMREYPTSGHEVVMFGSELIFSMWACVGLTQFLWADWLLIPYTPVHIVTVAMAVSLLISPATPTHFFFCHATSSPQLQNSTPSNTHFFHFLLTSKTRRSSNLRWIFVCAHAWLNSSALTGISLLHPLFSHYFYFSDCDLCTVGKK